MAPKPLTKPLTVAPMFAPMLRFTIGLMGGLVKNVLSGKKPGIGGNLVVVLLIEAETLLGDLVLVLAMILTLLVALLVVIVGILDSEVGFFEEPDLVLVFMLNDGILLVDVMTL